MKDEKLCYFWGSLKNPSFREEVLRKTNIYREGLPIRGGLGHFANLRQGGPWQERGEVVVLKGREGDTPMHTMNLVSYFTSKISKVRLISLKVKSQSSTIKKSHDSDSDIS